MLTIIRSYFVEYLTLSTESTEEKTIELAAAALLIEVTRADYKLEDSEETALKNILMSTFGINPAELDELLQLAEQESRDVTSYYQFTRLVNDQYTPEQKSALIEAMWRIAYADQDLNKYEEHLIRKIAELIYVPHKEFIRTKLAVARATK